MTDYKSRKPEPLAEYSQLVIFWLNGILFLLFPIYFFVKRGVLPEENFLQTYQPLLMILFYILLGIVFKFFLFRQQLKMDENEIIYRRWFKQHQIKFSKIKKVKSNNIDLIIYLEKKKYRIHLNIDNLEFFIRSFMNNLQRHDKLKCCNTEKLLKSFWNRFKSTYIEGIMHFSYLSSLIILYPVMIYTILLKKGFVVSISVIIFAVISIFIFVAAIDRKYKTLFLLDQFYIPPRDKQFEVKVIRFIVMTIIGAWLLMFCCFKYWL